MFEQRENEEGYFIYFNKLNGRTQNEDPKLLEILTEVKDKYKEVKYTTYRSALKLFSLQTALQTISIPFSMVATVLDHHRLNEIDTSPQIKPFQLTSVIFDIFYASEKLGYFLERNDFDLQSACSVLANFFWNVFDPNRSTPISLLELKQTFLILCNLSSYEEIIFEHFLLGADHNRCFNRLRFESILKVLSKIMIYLDEGKHYGLAMIQNIVDESFIECPGIVGLNEYQFNCLWKNNMKNNENDNFLNYANILSISHRIKESQFILHDKICINCKVIPIQGLRFKCKRCKKFSLCLKCFSIGYMNDYHDITHRMYEISTNNNIKKRNKITTILSKICNWFSTSSTTTMSTSNRPHNTAMNMETKLIDSSVDIDSIEICPDINQDEIKTDSIIMSKLSNGKVNFDNSGSNNISVIDRLMEIIDLLSEENESIQRKLKNPVDLHNFLENHSKILSDQIKQLKLIWEKSNSYLIPNSSTPLRQHNNNNNNSGGKRSIDLCSPLSRSIHGIEVNKTYLEHNNKSDLSVRDISSWLQMRRSVCGSFKENNTFTNSSNIETEMTNFKFLLHKVKEIVDDSYSDNIELSNATHHLEKVLDDIIGEEERKRL